MICRCVVISKYPIFYLFFFLDISQDIYPLFISEIYQPRINRYVWGLVEERRDRMRC